MERMNVIGMEIDTERIISGAPVPCVECERETAGCRKLYVEKGSLETVCVDMS